MATAITPQPELVFPPSMITETPPTSWEDDITTSPTIPDTASTVRVYVTHRFTPEFCAKLLALNTKNRGMKRVLWERIKNALICNQWKFIGDPIRISISGILLDGQHRCKACVESGVPFEAILITGLPDETFSIMDSGLSRTAGDTLGIDQCCEKPLANALSSVVTRALATKGVRCGVLSNEDKRAFARENIELLNASLGWGKRIKTATKVSVAIGATVFFLGAEKDRQKTEEFFQALETGDSLITGSPVKALRDRWLALGGAAGHYYTEALMSGLKALKAYQNGESMQRIRITRKEKFPQFLEA